MLVKGNSQKGKLDYTNNDTFKSNSDSWLNLCICFPENFQDMHLSIALPQIT